jgi:dUTP pyrophosphatase
MKNIDRLRKLSAKEMAMFLVSVCAETPVDFCNEICNDANCDQLGRCKYSGTEGEIRAWSEWLTAKHIGGEETELMEIKVQLDKGAYMPERAHKLDAGYDLRTPKRLVAYPRDSILVDTGVHMEIPQGYVGFLKSKSGLNVINDLTGTGTIDAGYTGSITVKLYNHGGKMHTFRPGDKLIQIVIVPIITPKLVEVDELDETERGDNGFGSTGR